MAFRWRELKEIGRDENCRETHYKTHCRSLRGGEGRGGINVTTYLGAFMDLETVVSTRYPGRGGETGENN